MTATKSCYVNVKMGKEDFGDVPMVLMTIQMGVRTADEWHMGDACYALVEYLVERYPGDATNNTRYTEFCNALCESTAALLAKSSPMELVVGDTLYTLTAVVRTEEQSGASVSLNLSADVAADERFNVQTALQVAGVNTALYDGRLFPDVLECKGDTVVGRSCIAYLIMAHGLWQMTGETRLREAIADAACDQCNVWMRG